jgi:opacity protein-like surface antigen
MYRLIIAVMLILEITVASFAADRNCELMAKRWKIALSGGYATVDMNDVNNDYSNSAASFGGGSVTKIQNGWYGALEALFNVYPRLALGPRVEYLKTNQGQLSVPGFGQTEDLSIVPIMVGGRYSLKAMSDCAGGSFCDNCGLTLGLFLGGSTAWGQLDSGQTIKYGGGGFAAEALLGWEHRVVDDLLLGLDVGYRYAPVTEMKTSQDYFDLGITKDTPIVDINGNTLKYDFSGLVLGVSVGYKF